MQVPDAETKRTNEIHVEASPWRGTSADVAEGGCVTGPGVANTLLQFNILLPACASASVFAFRAVSQDFGLGWKITIKPQDRQTSMVSNSKVTLGDNWRVFLSFSGSSSPPGGFGWLRSPFVSTLEQGGGHSGGCWQGWLRLCRGLCANIGRTANGSLLKDNTKMRSIYNTKIYGKGLGSNHWFSI